MDKTTTKRDASARIAEQLKLANEAFNAAAEIAETHGVEFYFDGPTGHGGTYRPRSAWVSSNDGCEWESSPEEGIDVGWVSSSIGC